MIIEKVIKILNASNGGVVSSALLCKEFGISRAAVWKHIQTLRGLGYQIKARAHYGYSLVSSPDLPLSGEVIPLLQTRCMGRELKYLLETASTNRDATRLAHEGAGEGFTVVAEAQTGGRGRMDRAWFSPAGVNLHVSVVLRPSIEPARATTLPLVAGMALVKSLEVLAPEIRAKVKWPNDILVGDKKICGILCEMQVENDVVRQIVMGFGLNVNLTESMLTQSIRQRATSMCIETGRVFPRHRVLATILNQFEPLYERWQGAGFAALLPELSRYDALQGRVIELEQGGRCVKGQCMGVAPDGALLLATSAGETLVYSGEAHILQW